jgi:hypothetical protein
MPGYGISFGVAIACLCSEGVQKYALDNLRHPAGTVGARAGHFVYVRRVHSHFIDRCAGGAGSPHNSRTQDRIVRSGPRPDAGPGPRRLAKPTQQVRNEQNDQDGPQTYPCATSWTPAAMAVISSASCKQQYQNDDEYQHRIFSFLVSWT